jgi:hypothetical protein
MPLDSRVSYPGLDITAGFFPFLRRTGTDAAGAGGGGGGCWISGSATRCRLGRRVDDVLAGSGSAAGLGSRALRFFAEVARVEGPGEGTTGGFVGASEELAACLAAALVVLLLGGMSTCV